MKTKSIPAAKRALSGSVLTALLLATGPQVAQAEEDTESLSLWAGSKVGLAFRYRFEYVDQDSFALDAEASTLRTRLNFNSGERHGFSFFVEGDWIAEIGPDDFNAGAGNTPDRTQYPVVADPDGTDLNQAYIQWRGDRGTLVRGGRTRIIYDNARFVGNVGWRQNEQTYDAVYLQHKTAGVNLQAAWVDQVNRIFGRDVPAGEHDQDTWLFNVSKGIGSAGSVTGYYYDIENQDAAAFSTQTFGMRLTGKLSSASLPLAFAAEVAYQEDAHNNPVIYSATYYRLDLSLPTEGFIPYIGFESLGGDADRLGAAFRTPLATLHAFNGWADQFLSTPNAGLQDLFLGIKGKAAGWSWNLLFHDFSAESGGADFGKELDASLGRSVFDRVSVLFKVAHFRAERQSSFADTTKFWIQLSTKF